MLIPLIDLYNKYNLDIRGVIHIGAYNAEELPAYRECNVPKVIWIEALPNLAGRLVQRFKDDDTQHVICDVISDKIEEVEFKVTNNEASSSILELGTHLQHHPKIYEEKRELVTTITMAKVIDDYGINIDQYNFLNIDIQGAELKCLVGMGAYLNKIDYLYLEVNTEEVYKGCALLHEIENFLTDFQRVEINMTKYGWGDGFWLRKTLL